MKKMIFLNNQELSNVVEEMYLANGKTVSAEVSFCEESELDVVILSTDSETETVVMEDLQDDLGKHLGVEITEYDEMEVGDFGIGYVFFH